MRQLDNIDPQCHPFECEKREITPAFRPSSVAIDYCPKTRGCSSVYFEGAADTPSIFPIDYCAKVPHVSSLKFVEGGGTFCCLLLIVIIMVFLVVQLLIWRFFDIDIYPVDDSMSNHDLSNTSIHRLDKLGKLP